MNVFIISLFDFNRFFLFFHHLKLFSWKIWRKLPCCYFLNVQWRASHAAVWLAEYFVLFFEYFFFSGCDLDKLLLCLISLNYSAGFLIFFFNVVFGWRVGSLSDFWIFCRLFSLSWNNGFNGFNGFIYCRTVGRLFGRVF